MVRKPTSGLPKSNPAFACHCSIKVRGPDGGCMKIKFAALYLVLVMQSRRCWAWCSLLLNLLGLNACGAYIPPSSSSFPVICASLEVFLICKCDLKSKP